MKYTKFLTQCDTNKLMIQKKIELNKKYKETCKIY